MTAKPHTLLLALGAVCDRMAQTAMDHGMNNVDAARYVAVSLIRQAQGFLAGRVEDAQGEFERALKDAFGVTDETPAGKVTLQ